KKAKMDNIPSILTDGNRQIDNTEELVDKFNAYFSSVFINVGTITEGSTEESNILNELDISLNDVLWSLGMVNCNKAVGPFSIPNIILIECRDVIAVQTVSFDCSDWRTTSGS